RGVLFLRAVALRSVGLGRTSFGVLNQAQARQSPSGTAQLARKWWSFPRAVSPWDRPRTSRSGTTTRRRYAYQSLHHSHGAAVLSSSAPPSASGTPPTSGTSTWVSGWPERYILDLYLFTSGAFLHQLAVHARDGALQILHSLRHVRHRVLNLRSCGGSTEDGTAFRFHSGTQLWPTQR